MIEVLQYNAVHRFNAFPRITASHSEHSCQWRRKHWKVAEIHVRGVAEGHFTRIGGVLHDAEIDVLPAAEHLLHTMGSDRVGIDIEQRKRITRAVISKSGFIRAGQFSRRAAEADRACCYK